MQRTGSHLVRRALGKSVGGSALYRSSAFFKYRGHVVTKWLAPQRAATESLRQPLIVVQVVSHVTVKINTRGLCRADTSLRLTVWGSSEAKNQFQDLKMTAFDPECYVFHCKKSSISRCCCPKHGLLRFRDFFLLQSQRLISRLGQKIR